MSTLVKTVESRLGNGGETLFCEKQWKFCKFTCAQQCKMVE